MRRSPRKKKEGKKEKKWEEGGGVDEGISVLTRRERQQRRFSLARLQIGWRRRRRKRRHTRRDLDWKHSRDR